MAGEMNETPRQSKAKNFVPSVGEPSDGEQNVSRRASKIPRANTKYFQIYSERLKKASDKSLTKSLTLSPKPKNVPEYSINKEKSALPGSIVSNATLKAAAVSSPRPDKSVRDLKVKLDSTKEKLTALLEEISQKHSSAVRMRQDLLSTKKALQDLTGTDQSFEDDFIDSYSKSSSVIAALVTNLPEGWLNMALKFATYRKNIIQKGIGKQTKELINDLDNDIADIEKEKTATNNKILAINKKIQEISLDATERLKAYEKLVEEKRSEIQCLKDSLAKLAKREDFPLSARSPRLYTQYQYQALLKESRDEKRRLEKEVEKKVAECKRVTEELSQLMEVLNEVQKRNPSEILIKQKQELDSELRDKNNLMKIVTEENKKLKEIIGKMKAGSHDSENTLSNDPVVRNKKVQAELDPKHRSSRRQIQILKLEMRRLEHTVRKLSTTDEIMFITPVTKVIGELKGIGSDEKCTLGQMNGILTEGNGDIRRLESILTRMQDHQKSAATQKALTMNRIPAKISKILPINKTTALEV